MAYTHATGRSKTDAYFNVAVIILTQQANAAEESVDPEIWEVPIKVKW
jgi:hypothetical protein